MRWRVRVGLLAVAAAFGVVSLVPLHGRYFETVDHHDARSTRSEGLRGGAVVVAVPSRGGTAESNVRATVGVTTETSTTEPVSGAVVDAPSRRADQVASPPSQTATTPSSPDDDDDGAAHGRVSRYMTFNPLQPWYGLTNQMMCYAAALRYGIDDNRAVLFPAHVEVNDVLPFYDLFEVNATQRGLGSAVLIMLPSEDDITYGYYARKGAAKPGFVDLPRRVPRALYPPTSMNKKKLFLPQRTEFRLRDRSRLEASRQYMLKRVYGRSERFDFVRHHNLFMRFAWPMRQQSGGWDECRLMNVLQPQADIVAFANALVTGMGPAAGRSSSSQSAGMIKFVAVHLRVEVDASLLRPSGARAPTGAQFKTFLVDHVTPFARQAGASFVYLCTGKLPADFGQVVDDWNEEQRGTGDGGIFVVHRALIVSANDGKLPPIRKFVGAQRAMHAAKGGTQTQDHYMSFVELLMLSRASRAAVTGFSSLRFSVFAKRCHSEDNVVEKAVHTFHIDDRGGFGALQRWGCDGARAGYGWCGHDEWGESVAR